ncbi:LIC12162 family transferase [Fodinibius sp. AD559]|uniref:LIC12162 family transferase n=1 Tax=Fodinibius sp. AD559 TaxID=3424179 RepID=UPI004046C833
MRENNIVLTGLKLSWKKNKKNIVIAPWCLNGNQENYEYEIDYTLTNLDHDDFKWASQKSQVLYERIIRIVAEKLNEIHGLNKSMRFWEILLGQFVYGQIELLIERKIYIDSILDKYSNVQFSLIANDSFGTPDVDLFYLMLYNHTFNLQLFSQLIVDNEYYESELSVKLNQADDFFSREQADDYSKSSGYLALLKNTLNSVFNYRDKGFESEFALRTGGISSINRWKLTLLTGLRVWGAYKVGDLPSLKKITLDDGKREKLKEIRTEDDFQNKIIEAISINIPKIYIEGFDLTRGILEDNVDLNKNPTAILTGRSSDPLVRLWQAECVERNSKLVAIQHGGGYGEVDFNQEKFERSVSDFLVTWGWKEHDKDLPLPASKLIGKNEYTAKKRGGVVWITNSVEHYNTRRYRLNITRQQIFGERQNFIEWNNTFAGSISEKVIQNIEIRFKPVDIKYDDLKKVLYHYLDLSGKPTENLKKLSLDDWSLSLTEKARNARLVVFDQFGSTSFLELIGLNKPVILFADIDYEDIRDIAKPYYKKLEEYDIFHRTPESAAQTVNEIFEDPETWWNEPGRNQCVDNFRDTFAWTDDEALKKWKEFILELSD